MNFKAPGWFEKYINFRKENPFPDELPGSALKLFQKSASADSDFEHTLYNFLQPSGIMYGFPVVLPFTNVEYPGFKYMDSADKMVLIFLESLFAPLYVVEKKVNSEKTPAQIIDNIVPLVISYFNSMYPESPEESNHDTTQQTFKTFEKFSNNEQSLFIFEKILTTQILNNPVGIHLTAGKGAFMFLDLYLFFHDYFHGKAIPVKEKRILYILTKKQKMVTSLLRLMVLASHASHSLEKEEFRLFDYFITAANLPADLAENFKDEFKKGVDISSIEVNEYSWLSRRFFLEISLLFVFSDKNISSEEKDFLEILLQKLKLEPEEKQQSFLALNTFLTLHETKLPVSGKMGYVVSQVQEMTSKILLKNKDRVYTEIKESRELYSLLMKSRNEKLSDEEKHKVKEQLLDILKSIPTLVALVLPGAFITLPLLMKLLPKEMFPSAFRE